jgi:hypothetical protein
VISRKLEAEIMIKDCLDEEQNVRKPTERGEEGCLTNRSMK